MTAPNAYPILTTLRDALAAVPGVATCKIGMESTITPADYPMVRIVATGSKWGSLIASRLVSIDIFFGLPAHEFTGGLEALYSALCGMEQDLMIAVLGLQGVVNTNWIETIYDEDKVSAYKLACLKVSIDG